MQAALSEQAEGPMHQPPYQQTDLAALSEQAEGLQDVPQADLVALEHAGWGAHKQRKHLALLHRDAGEVMEI